MLKKVALAAVLILLVIGVGGFFWVRSAFTGDLVRTTLADQVSKAIGQPVSIGRIGAGLSPQLTVTLGAVTIGQPARITADEVRLATSLRALLSRRIEHASVRLTGAKVELPLPNFTMGTSDPGASSGPSPVEIVSIDEIVLSDVQIVSGGRTVRADVELVPQGQGVIVRRVKVGAGDAEAVITGAITDLAGPKGNLQVKAGVLNLDELIAFANAFSAGAGSSSAAPSKPSGAAPPSAIDVTLDLEATRATMGALALEQLRGKARVAGDEVQLDPVSFGVFGGRYDGSLALTTEGSAVRFRSKSNLTNIDVAKAAAFGGSAGTITGTLRGRMDIAGRGADPSSVLSSARGTARVDIENGVIKNLGLVRAVVLATSMREGATSGIGSGSKDEPFTSLGGTLNLAGGAVTTSDLALDSKNLALAAQGTVNLIAGSLDLKGRVQLSDELSKQAGRDLLRLTSDNGRVTLPATISGTIDAPSVRIDVGDMAKRALQNVANEQKERAKAEASKAIGKKLGGLFKR